MNLLYNHHVQVIFRNDAATNYTGILKPSECGEEFIKLIPWEPEFQKTHIPWPSVSGSIHIRQSDIRAIVDIDTIDANTIEQFARQSKGKEGLGVGNDPPKYLASGS